MSLFDFLKKILPSSTVTDASRTSHISQSNPSKKLTFAEKELLAVQHTTMQDVQRLSGFPYTWNRSIEKSIVPHGHPFVYMDIVGPNIEIAKSELGIMNCHIEQAKNLCKKIPKSLTIPVSDIVFTRSAVKGYTKLICSPVTHTGEPSEFPLTLSFMTNMDRSDTTHGDLAYGRDGNISKASVFFWRRERGYFLHFENINSELTLARVEHCCPPDNATTVFKGAHILAAEAQREKESEDFQWIQANIPDKCPKSISSYRRMKTQNTKNYQILKQLAADKGRNI